MDVGVVFPQIEIGSDPAVLSDFARTVEESGYEHILAYDHVLGANPESRPDWSGPYDYETPFHEVFSLFSYYAAVTDDVELITGVLILPQRQTALVAKQAAEVDVLSEGRLRLGVGVGWNAPEYVALNEDFSNRGRRVEEQVEVLRALWTNELVEFEGEYHEIPDVGILPLPVQQPIPIWMGGGAEPVLRRMGRMADGWFPQFQPEDEDAAKLDRLYEYAEEAGRDPDDIGIHGRYYAVPGEEDEWIERATAWGDLGVEHLSINSMYQDLEGEAHAEHLADVASVLEDAGFL